jgi:hypothetical protein
MLDLGLRGPIQWPTILLILELSTALPIDTLPFCIYGYYTNYCSILVCYYSRDLDFLFKFSVNYDACLICS